MDSMKRLSHLSIALAAGFASLGAHVGLTGMRINEMQSRIRIAQGTKSGKGRHRLSRVPCTKAAHIRVCRHRKPAKSRRRRARLGRG